MAKGLHSAMEATRDVRKWLKRREKYNRLSFSATAAMIGNPYLANPTLGLAFTVTRNDDGRIGIQIARDGLRSYDGSVSDIDAIMELIQEHIEAHLGEEL